MIFITPLLLLFSVFTLWALIKSLSRFQTEFSWYQRPRPSNRVCRTVVTRQQASVSAPQCQQGPEQIRIREGPFPLQICRNNRPASNLPIFQPAPTYLMNDHVPMNYALPRNQAYSPLTELAYPHPCYYNPAPMHLFHDPPPAYDFRPVQVPMGCAERIGPRLSSAPCPSAPPDVKDLCDVLLRKQDPRQ